MIYCFDTSAINQLNDDTERKALLAGLLAAHSVYVTAVNCIEAMGTSTDERRQKLQVLLRELARGLDPLALPFDLLKSQTIDYAAGRSRPPSTKLTYGMSVDDYFRLEGKAKEEVQDLKRRWEKSFEVFGRVRPIFEQKFKDGDAERPPSFAALIREHYKEKAFLFSIMEDVYTITGEKLEASKLAEFFVGVPEWPVVLLGLAYASYARSMKKEGYSRRGKAGAVDLWSFTYLPHIDVFVTHDNDQFRALRLANIVNSRETKALRYNEFRQRLLIG
jgi:hypothetical protein